MREIPLAHRDQVALVDDEDFDYLSRWKWKLHPQGYASRTTWINRKWVTLLMHRVIVEPAAGLEVDHRNGDKLDNRRANLRAVTHALNERNKPLNPRNKSGYKGVFWNKEKHQWTAKTKHAGRHVYLGHFDSVEDAAAAYVAYVASIGETP